MDKRFISEVHPPVPVVLIYASESGSQGFGVPVMTICITPNRFTTGHESNHIAASRIC